MTLKKISTSTVIRKSPKYENLRVGYVPTTSTPTIEVLVVGGGGGSGYYNGSGGGAGGILYSSSLAVTAGVSCTVTIGAGGASVPDTSGSNVAGSNGGDSVFRSGVAKGGGGGGGGSSVITAGNSGGCGGGGQNGNPGSSTQANPSDGMTGFGFAGGSGTNAGGGGGGAGGVGGSGATRSGGLGKSYTFDVAATYAGGGQGSSGVNAAGSAGHSGHFGGGGEGDGNYGGPGICIIRYPDTYKLATTTGAPGCSISGGYITYYFVASGSITF